MSAAIDFARDVVLRRPGTATVLEPLGGGARIAEVAPGGIAEAKSSGYDGVAVEAPASKPELDQLLRAYGGFLAIVYLKPEQIGWDVRPAQAVLMDGIWPGIAPRDVDRASATSSVWLDANTSLIAQLRAQYPWRRAVLGYRPKPERSLPPFAAEVALADAFPAGGNVVLTVPENFRGSVQTLTDLQSFLRGHAATFDAPLTGRTAVLCGSLEETSEILNLAFRKNLCPVPLAPEAALKLSPAQYDVVVAANLALSAPVVESVARYAEGGGVVLAAGPSRWWESRGWKKLRAEEGRDVFAAGRGIVYGYHDAVYDPGAFALDIRDAAGQRSTPGFGLKNLDLRIWSADSVLGVLHRAPPASVALVLTAYGNPPRHDFLISVRGRFRRGTIRQPGERDSQPLRLMPRAGRVEINLAQLARIAILTLEE